MVLRLLPEAQGPESQVIFVPGKLVTLVVHRELFQREQALKKLTPTDRKEGASNDPTLPRLCNACADQFWPSTSYGPVGSPTLQA